MVIFLIYVFKICKKKVFCSTFFFAEAKNLKFYYEYN